MSIVKDFFFPAIACILFNNCAGPETDQAPTTLNDSAPAVPDTMKITTTRPPNEKKLTVIADTIKTGNTSPAEIVAYALTLIGVPYKYASTDPAVGFDCSGFITYVFRHFNISVPRSSVDFTNIGEEIDSKKAGPGDIILFTGTDSTIRVVGHMGIVISNEGGQLQFIHSSSGKAKGVVVTVLGDYYKSRFVKLIRVFPDRFFSWVEKAGKIVTHS